MANFFVLLAVLGIVLRFWFLADFTGMEYGYIKYDVCVEDVDVRSDKVKYTVSGDDFEGRILISMARYPLYDYGDCLALSGELLKPEPFNGFAYDKYLARYGIYGVMYRPWVELVGERPMALKWIYGVRQDFERRLGRIYAEPHGSFMAGLIVGSRKGIPDDLMEDFGVTGLTHIIAISGYNITLVIVIVGAFFGALGRKWKVILSGIFVVLFVILVGASAAVVRAGIMGVIGLVALWFGRQYYAGIALFVAGWLMVMWNPFVLLYDVGFQLSFLATAGLIWVSPGLERFVGWVPEGLGVREAFLMTISAQTLALPIIMINFESLSLISPIANIFVLPFIPWAMIFGFVAVAFSYFSQFLSLCFGFLGYLVLELVIWIVELFAGIKWAAVEVQWFNWWIAIGYYAFLLYLLRKTR